MFDPKLAELSPSILLFAANGCVKLRSHYQSAFIASDLVEDAGDDGNPEPVKGILKTFSGGEVFLSFVEFRHRVFKFRCVIKSLV